MFCAMPALVSSLARRLVPHRRRTKRITSSSALVARRRPFFPCGGGRRDVVSDSAFVVAIKRCKTTPRKKVGERKRGRGGDYDDDLPDADGDEACVWRRAILLGRRCQPLEFAGAIHYDCEGQRLWQPRTPPPSPPPPRVLSPVHPSELGYMDRA